MSITLNSHDTTLLQKIDKIFGKLVMVPGNRKIKPDGSSSSSSSNSSYNSITEMNNVININNDYLSINLSNELEQKKNNIDLNVYMKCFVHELRTPISTISLGVNLLKNSDQTEENRDTINTINKSIVFIENILTKFAIVQDGNIELNEFEPLSLKKMITNVELLIFYILKDSNVEFNYFIDNRVNDLCYGDIHNITHVIINLLKNSVKYQDNTRENKITIIVTPFSNETYVKSNNEQNQTISISICDTNKHILPSIKEHLFETFNSTSGSGMGLFICKTIIELHGGKILHTFIGSIGNEFTIILTLTICNDSSLYIQTPVSNQILIKDIYNNGNYVKKYNVLVVDDSALNRKMMYKTLKMCPNFNKIHTAEDGIDAITKIKKFKDEISIVLMDKNMPRMNGLESVKTMRSLSYDKIILGLTGEDSIDEINEFVECGADYVITKPLDNKKLSLISTFLEKYGETREINKKIQIVNDQLEWV